MNQPGHDEETPLLRQKLQPPIPLPKLQISIVLLLQLGEPITSQSIYPYINQLVSELDITGGDERKVGYYAGLIESLFFATEAVTVLQWSRLSDHIGRKPVLLTGLIGSCISLLCFGLSRTFWTLVVSRCLTGMLNGNIGVMKSVMAELTHPSNRADGFALIPIVWAAGATLGPLMGGSLSRPHERFPNIFGGFFWQKYPYFLPCLVAASFVFMAFLIALLLFKETLHTGKAVEPTSSRSEGCAQEAIAPSMRPTRSPEGPVPLRDLLVFPILISVTNYVSLAFLNISLSALLPLFLAMPVEIGGVGLSPPMIGYILGAYGAASGIFQVFFFARIVRRFGVKNVFVLGMFTFLPIFALFPIMSLLIQRLGFSPIVWCLMALLLALSAVMDMAYGCIFMYITAAAPNKRSLGSTNGLSQTTCSIARAIGPALSSSLFSLSVEHNILGGYGVYAIFVLLSALSLLLAARLPQELWTEGEE